MFLGDPGWLTDAGDVLPQTFGRGSGRGSRQRSRGQPAGIAAVQRKTALMRDKLAASLVKCGHFGYRNERIMVIRRVSATVPGLTLVAMCVGYGVAAYAWWPERATGWPEMDRAKA